MADPQIPPRSRVVIASRQSDLAKIQAYMVADELRRNWPGLEVVHHFRESLGDINLTDPLWKIPERGVFTEDFVQGLARGEFDAVVHSWKDLPTEARPGAEIVATLPRADARDLVFLRKDLPAGGAWKILSSSPRRAHNLRDFFQTYLPIKPAAVEFQSVRGNVPRRIEKLTSGEGDGLILAKAAFDRLLDERYAEFAPTREKLRRWTQNFWVIVLPTDLNPPAAAQGALAIEIRSDREDLRALFAPLNHRPTFEAVQWERRRLSEYGGGCHLKIGLLQTTLTAHGGPRLTLERGQTPAGEEFFHRQLEVPARPRPPAGPTLAPRTEDLFEIESVTVSPEDLQALRDQAVRIAHRRALGPEILESLRDRGPQDPWIWASGLESWRKLAELGLWVRGCDENRGTESGLSQNLNGLRAANAGISVPANADLSWTRLTHDERGDAPASGDERILPTYRLVAKPLSAEQLDLFTQARAFFWRSGRLFRAALAALPELRDRNHSCGPGATRHVLEQELGRPLENSLFLGESDWRNWLDQLDPERPLT